MIDVRIRETQWLEDWIQVGILDAATIVKLDDVAKRLDAAVMHVGRRQHDTTQSGRFELADIGFLAGDSKSTEVDRPFSPTDTGIVK